MWTVSIIIKCILSDKCFNEEDEYGKWRLNVAIILHTYIKQFIVYTGEIKLIWSLFYLLNNMHYACVMEVENARVFPLTELSIERLYMV